MAQQYSAGAYLGIASGLAVISTFAGSLTFGNAISLSVDSVCSDGGTARTLLSVAFVLFTSSLFVTIAVQVSLRAYEPDKMLPEEPHLFTQVFVGTAALLVAAGFILLDVVLIQCGQAAAGGTAIGVTAFIAALISWISWRTHRSDKARA